MKWKDALKVKRLERGVEAGWSGRDASIQKGSKFRLMRDRQYQQSFPENVRRPTINHQHKMISTGQHTEGNHSHVTSIVADT